MYTGSPLSPIVRMKFSFHQGLYVVFSKSELGKNRIKWRPVFPRHFNNPVDILQAQRFQFSHECCSVMFKQIREKKVHTFTSVKPYPMLEASLEAVPDVGQREQVSNR